MDSVFFILSKLAWILLSPANLIILLVLIAIVMLFIKKVSMAKWLLSCTMLFATSLLFYPLGDKLIYPLEARFSKPEPLPVAIDGIIVLGGAAQLIQSANWGTMELGTAADRYIGAAILAKRYPSAPVIFSGGSGLLGYQDLSREGDIARSLLTVIGIDDNRLIIEQDARNTFENFLLLKPLLPDDAGTYLLITSAYHMTRAVGIARKQHINVIPYPVDYRSSLPMFSAASFSLLHQLNVLEPAWREWIGLTVYYLTGKTSAWLPK